MNKPPFAVMHSNAYTMMHNYPLSMARTIYIA